MGRGYSSTCARATTYKRCFFNSSGVSEHVTSASRWPIGDADPVNVMAFYGSITDGFVESVMQVILPDGRVTSRRPFGRRLLRWVQSASRTTQRRRWWFSSRTKIWAMRSFATHWDIAATDRSCPDILPFSTACLICWGEMK